METRYIIFALIFLLSFTAKAQYAYEYQNTTVTTPTGVPVNALQFKYWVYNDFTSEEQALEDYQMTHNYNCEVISSSTKYYNCHGYAWHNVEGNMEQDKLRWIDDIDYNSNPTYNVHRYYSTVHSNGKPSYREVFTNNKANLKVSYFPRDHSAITTSNPEYLISKWAWGPLVKHAISQCPFYKNAQIKYYESIFSFSISGPSTICDQTAYTINNLPAGATVRWSIKEGLNRGFSISPQGVLSASVQTAIYGAPIVIQAAIEYPGTPEIKLTKSISTMPEKILFSVNATYMSGNYVNPQLLHVTISGASHDICPPGQYRYMVNGHPAVGYENGMTVDLSSSEIRSDFYLALQDYPPDFISSGELELKILFTPRNPNSQSVSGTNGCIIANMRRSFSLSPNPTTDAVTLQLMETDEVSGLSVLSTDRSPYEIQLWSGMTMLRSFRTNEPTFQIPMAGLPAGLYFVRVVKDGQTYTQKLIKK